MRRQLGDEAVRQSNSFCPNAQYYCAFGQNKFGCLATSSPQWFRLPCTVEVYSDIKLDELYVVKKTRCKKLQNSRRKCGGSATSAILTFFISFKTANFKVP